MYIFGNLYVVLRNYLKVKEQHCIISVTTKKIWDAQDNNIHKVGLHFYYEILLLN